MKILKITSIFILTLALASFTTKYPPGDWEFLGQRKVQYIGDKDEILVTAKEGTFKALKLQVKGAPIFLKHVKVHYGNGDVQHVNVNKRIPAGKMTPKLDLPGKRRIIRKVVFFYRTVPNAPRKAVVHLYGLQ